MANFNFNKAILGGRLTADPELKTTPSGLHVVSFKLAINRRNSSKDGDEAKTDFIGCVAWRQTADFITSYFRKGSSICVVGSIQTRSWVAVDEASFVDSKSDAVIPDAGKQPEPAYEEIEDNSDLPF